MRRLLFILLALIALAALGFGGFLLITAPKPRSAAEFAGLTGDAAHGEQVFWAGGCASCHATWGAKGADALVLNGGQHFDTAFGKFFAPNISTHPTEGIGGWDILTFANAVTAGVLPDGSHEYPAMPYAAYAKMTAQDLVDLKAFMDGLPASDQANRAHVLSFPFNQRVMLGGWKLLFFSKNFVMSQEMSEEQARGRYLAEALAHCGECHTPRNVLGGLQTSRWFAGAPLLDDDGKVPNITSEKLTWSDKEIFAYLTTGATPDFDFVGGQMAEVVNNLSKLPEADIWSLVAYLKTVPPQP